jgi:hypothetical protein
LDVFQVLTFIFLTDQRVSTGKVEERGLEDISPSIFGRAKHISQHTMCMRPTRRMEKEGAAGGKQGRFDEDESMAEDA